MKPALEKFLLIAATLAAIGIFIYVALWTSIKDKKTQMDNLFNSTNVPTSFHWMVPTSPPSGTGSVPPAFSIPGDAWLVKAHDEDSRAASLLSDMRQG